MVVCCSQQATIPVFLAILNGLQIAAYLKNTDEVGQLWPCWESQNLSETH